jgi:hypothetical protein
VIPHDRHGVKRQVLKDHGCAEEGRCVAHRSERPEGGDSLVWRTCKGGHGFWTELAEGSPCHECEVLPTPLSVPPRPSSAPAGARNTHQKQDPGPMPSRSSHFTYSALDHASQPRH